MRAVSISFLLLVLCAFAKGQNDTATSETSQDTSFSSSIASSASASNTEPSSNPQPTTALPTTAFPTTSQGTTGQSMGNPTSVATTGAFSTTGGSNTSSTYPFPRFVRFITENANHTHIEPQAGIACVTPPPNQYYRPHRYYRMYPLAADFGINTDYQVSAVTIGIERANGRLVLCQPISVQIYYKDNDNIEFTDQELVSVKNKTVGVPNMELGFLTVGISATIPRGKVLVVVVETVDGLATQSTLFMGANTLGEYSPSLLVTPSCRIDRPTPYTAIGFNSSLVWAVSDDADPAVPNYDAQCNCIPDSCSNYCRSKPPCGTSNCWCDSTCDFYGDCCADFNPICTGVVTTQTNTDLPTASQEFTNAFDSKSSEDGGLTQKQKAGIAAGAVIGGVIAIVVAIIVVAFVVFQVRRAKLRKAKLAQYREELEMKDEQKM